MTEIEIFEEYKWTVYKTCYYMLQDQYEAEDITQNVFIQVFSKDHSKVDNIKAWVIKIAINMCKNFLKRKKRMIVVENIRKKIVLMPSEPVMGEFKNEVDVLLAKLPERAKSVIILKYLHDLKYSEIAKMLNISEGSAKASCHYGLKLLRNQLEHRNLREILEEGL